MGGVPAGESGRGSAQRDGSEGDGRSLEGGGWERTRGAGSAAVETVDGHTCDSRDTGAWGGLPGRQGRKVMASS